MGTLPVPRWAIDSPLDRMTRGQSRLNELGRARISGDGKLRDRDGVQHPHSLNTTGIAWFSNIFSTVRSVTP